MIDKNNSIQQIINNKLMSEKNESSNIKNLKKEISLLKEQIKNLKEARKQRNPNSTADLLEAVNNQKFEEEKQGYINKINQLEKELSIKDITIANLNISFEKYKYNQKSKENSDVLNINVSNMY